MMDHDFVFAPHVKDEFAQYLRLNPNRRRISRTDQQSMIDWLTDSATQPISQRESSRRHYVKKTFAWDAKERTLIELPNGPNAGQKKSRKVVTEDNILETVEGVHRKNGHAGWDGTWKDVRDTYYGILRADVIFLLKRCHICAQDPRKRPKGFSFALEQPDTMATIGPDCFNLDLLQDDLIHDAQLGTR